MVCLTDCLHQWGCLTCVKFQIFKYITEFSLCSSFIVSSENESWFKVILQRYQLSQPQVLIPVLTQAKHCPVSPLPSLHCSFSLVPSSVASLGFFPPSFMGLKYRKSWQVEICHLINHQIWKIRVFVFFFFLSSSRNLTYINVFNAHCPTVNPIYKGQCFNSTNCLPNQHELNEVNTLCVGYIHC